MFLISGTHVANSNRKSGTSRFSSILKYNTSLLRTKHWEYSYTACISTKFMPLDPTLSNDYLL